MKLAHLDHLDPIRTSRGGRPVWLWPDGKVLPVVAGGEGPTGDGGGGSGGSGSGGSGSGSGGDGGSGGSGSGGSSGSGSGGQGGGSGGSGSDPGFPENTPVVEMTPAQQAAYWKDKARKHEARANQRADYDDIKKKADQYDQLAQNSKTEQERAIEAARSEAEESARKDERAKASVRLVDAEMRAAAAGRLSPEQLTAILDPVDRSKFVNTDGEVDTEKVVNFIASVAPASSDGGNGGRRFPDLGQGRRGGDGGNGGTTASVQSGRDRYKARHGRSNSTT